MMKRKVLLLLFCALGGLSSGCDIEGVCATDAKRCFNDENEQAQKSSCVDGFWADPVSYSTVSCNSDHTNYGECLNTEPKKCDVETNAETECVEGVYNKKACELDCSIDQKSCNECASDETEPDACKDGKLVYCQSGKFVSGKDCEFGCNKDGKRCADCSDGTVTCEGSRKIQVCYDGAWEHDSDCPDDLVCSNGECVESCMDGEILCEVDEEQGAVIKVCSEGSWHVQYACPFGQCSVDNKACSDCVENEFGCTNDEKTKAGTFSQCLNGKSVSLKCTNSVNEPVSCSDQKCGGCMNGAKKCENEMVSVCENGLWTEIEHCPSGCEFDVPACITEVVACVNNKTKCVSGVMYQCISNVWDEKGPCANGCDDFGEKCADTVSPNACNEGEARCENGSRFVCEASKWVSKETCAYGCASDGSAFCAPAPECNEGEALCTGGAIKRCIKGKWTNSQNCANGASCASESMCGVCTDGAVKCESMSVQTCVQGKWTVTQACAYDCNDSKSCRTTPRVCVDGQTQCIMQGSQAVQQTCVNGNWGMNFNCVNASCNGNVCGTCITGAMRCSGNNLQICKDATVWQTSEACPYGCNDSKNSCLSKPAECTSKDKSTCTNTNSIGTQTVCRDGEWKKESCGTRSCNATGTACGLCKNGDKKCTGGKAYVCSNGSWGEGTSCSYGCDEVEPRCGSIPECSNGSTKCTNGKLYTCEGRHWGEAKACTYGSCSSATACSVCQENTKNGCTNNSEKVCKNGQWQTQSCTYGCKADGTVCRGSKPVCSAGENSCSGGSIKTCDADGQWGAATSCGASCKNATTCGECTNDATKACYKCSAGTWVNSCSYGCKADGSGCKSIPVCSAGSKQCSNGSIKTCDADGQWGAATSCGSGIACKSDTACGTCKEGSKNGCGANGETVCKNGQWQTQSCSYGCKADGTGCRGSKPVCSAGEKSCSGGSIKTCDADGQWGAATSCGASCKNATTCGECTNDATKACYKCSAGTWVNSCSYGCKADGSGCKSQPVCSSGTKSCSGGSIKTCNADGQWGAAKSCNASCKSSTECGTCTNGDTKTCYKCSSGSWINACTYGCRKDGKGCRSSGSDPN